MVNNFSLPIRTVNAQHVAVDTKHFIGPFHDDLVRSVSDCLETMKKLHVPRNQVNKDEVTNKITELTDALVTHMRYSGPKLASFQDDSNVPEDPSDPSFNSLMINNRELAIWALTSLRQWTIPQFNQMLSQSRRRKWEAHDLGDGNVQRDVEQFLRYSYLWTEAHRRTKGERGGQMQSQTTARHTSDPSDPSGSLSMADVDIGDDGGEDTDMTL